MKPSVLFIAFLLLFPAPIPSSAQTYSHGTAIFAIRTPDEIAVAADSREIGARGLPVPTRVCKIRQIDKNIFITAYGLYEETQSDYNLWKIIQQAGKGFNTVSSMADSFESYLRSPLEKALKQIRMTSPEFYKEKCIKRLPLGVIFFGLEDEILVFRHRKVTIDDPASDHIWVNFLREDCPGSGCRDGNMAVAVAEERETESFSQSKKSLDLRSGVVDLARNFVMEVISKDPIKYASPIDIIYLNKDGANWIQKKAECDQKD
jgi:hypothetical protein